MAATRTSPPIMRCVGPFAWCTDHESCTWAVSRVRSLRDAARRRAPRYSPQYQPGDWDDSSADRTRGRTQDHQIWIQYVDNVGPAQPAWPSDLGHSAGAAVYEVQIPRRRPGSGSAWRVRRLSVPTLSRVLPNSSRVHGRVHGPKPRRWYHLYVLIDIYSRYNAFHRSAQLGNVPGPHLRRRIGDQFGFDLRRVGGKR